jgi:mannitol/fructose-specific phosphotransferase system IIA component
MNYNKLRHTTHGIVHAGFKGMQAFVARKKNRWKPIGNRLVIPHDTIPSNVVHHADPS